MKEEKLKTTVEVFVCNHEDCKKKGSKEVTDKLKKWSKEEHKGEIKVFRSGCLGMCSDGIAMACYPEKKFLLKVNEDDVKEIKQGLLEALRKAKD